MRVTKAVFISSVTNMRELPQDNKPEFAFIGRSNVGKSSLINLLTQRRSLAKTSSTPGKTQTVNHYLINDAWYLVDLPGYGYAHTSKEKKSGFGKVIEQYIKTRDIACVFILIDIRLEPQTIDIHFIQWIGSLGIPLMLVFTKVDKLSKSQTKLHVQRYEQKLLEQWETLPPVLLTSSTAGEGREDILTAIAEAIERWNGNSK